MLSTNHSRWESLLLHGRTVRYLKPVQIYSRFRPLPRIRTLHRFERRALTGRWTEPIKKTSPQTGPKRFCFLNQEREIRSWNDASASYLWLYNLHYFGYADETLVEKWIKENPVGYGIGWDPYPTSLRIANWCKWLLSGGPASERIYASIGVQAAWLEKRVERHLLANHLLANAKALVFAGSVFEGDAPDRWRKAGLRILEAELPVQILRDGAHFERSPMYQGILLEDMLDLCNLAAAFPGLLPSFTGYASRMIGWLGHMMHPDGKISFFNDATHGIAPGYAALRVYAHSLGIAECASPLGESGYARLENEHTVVLFDAAPLGPDYQPGHGHADALSFEASFRGRRVLVNSGTSTYEPGPVRQFERGTAAHNTVRVDGLDQSEMWAAFRVARRAHPFGFKTDQHSFVEAAHDGYQRLHPGIIHRRRIELDGDKLEITDWLEGAGRHTAELFYHLAPDATPVLRLDERSGTEIISSTYRTGFNSSIPNRTIVGRWSGECPVSFKTIIDLAGAAA